MSGQNSKPVLLIGATLLLVLVVITVLQRASRKEIVRTIPPRELSIMSEWDAAKFLDVADALLHTNWLDDIPTTNTTALSEAQSLALRRCLIASVRAFSSGSYDDYRAFVTPIPLPLRSNRVASIRDFLRDPSSKPTIGLTPKIKDARAVNQVVTHGSPEDLHRMYFRVASNYTAYKDYWQGIAVASSWVTTFSASALPTDLMNLLFERMRNVGALQALPSFDCFSKASADLESRKILSCADVCLLVRLKPPDPAAPFVIRLFWDPEGKVWVPYALGMANLNTNTAIQPVL